MIIKFLKDNKSYEFTSGAYNIDAEKVKFDSSTIPATAGGFTVINDSGIEVDYSQYKVPYEKTEKYITFTSDTKVYYTYLVYNETTGYVTSQTTTTKENLDNAILRKSGQGKEYSSPEIETILDDDGFYLYKVVDGVLTSTTEAEKTEWQNKKDESALESAISSKLNEISSACNAAIIAGIDYNGKHFSYDNDDQKNISNAATLAMTTGLGMPYHADGEACEVFSKEDIIAIYVAEETNLTLNTTYHNQLRLYVQTLGTKAEVDAIKYGETELVGSYKETYDAMIAQANLVIKKFVGEN